MLQLTWDWLSNLEWQRVLPELVGKGLGFLAGFAASWFLLFRRKLRICSGCKAVTRTT